MKNSRVLELEHLKIKILDAVRISKQFWITFRENTFGIASIINLIYKKSYFEVLFFTKYDTIEKGEPLLKIYSPISDEIDFSEILHEPDLDEDGLVNPKKIIQRMRKVIRREFQNRFTRLEYEAKLIDENYENYIINSNPFNREIRIFFEIFTLSLKINFEKYPTLPIISFSKILSKILSEREFSENMIIRNWNFENPPHVVSLINIISDIISTKLQIGLLTENSQHLIISNVSIGSLIDLLSFKVHRGKSIGIIYDEEQLNEIDHRLDLLNLFEAISGTHPEFSGSIKIFNVPIQSLKSMDKAKIFVLPGGYDSKLTKFKISKGIHYNIDINKLLVEMKKEFDGVLKNAGISLGIEEVMVNTFQEKSLIIKKKKKKLVIEGALKATGLINKKNKKFTELTPLEFLLFSIARALIQNPIILMFSIPFGILDKLEYEKFNHYIDRIKQEFHVILIFHGPEEIISNCDQILTITKKVTKVGTLEEFIEELPQLGEIITIELNNPNQIHLTQLKEMSEIEVIIEERNNEKYKIFLKNNINDVIIKITELLGPSLFSFKRSVASIKEYLEFNEYK